MRPGTRPRPKPIRPRPQNLASRPYCLEDLTSLVSGPLKFIAYMEDEVDTIKQHTEHNLNVHLYADDTQVYAYCYHGSIGALRVICIHAPDYLTRNLFLDDC